MSSWWMHNASIQKKYPSRSFAPLRNDHKFLLTAVSFPLRGIGFRSSPRDELGIGNVDPCLRADAHFHDVWQSLWLLLLSLEHHVQSWVLYLRAAPAHLSKYYERKAFQQRSCQGCCPLLLTASTTRAHLLASVRAEKVTCNMLS